MRKRWRGNFVEGVPGDGMKMFDGFELRWKL